MNKTNALVSIIIPTYNRAHLIRRALDSAINQTFRKTEIIVVDDNSQDNTMEIVTSYKDERVRYIRHQENKGASAARNTGIRESKGRYIAFLDSDDEWLREKLEKQIEKFKTSSPEVGAIYSGATIFSDGRRVLDDIPSKRGDIHADELIMDYVVGGGSSLVVRKECLIKVGGFNERLPARQDYDLALRLSKYCKYDFVEEPLVLLHWDSGGRITNARNRRIAGEMIIEKIREEIQTEPTFKQRHILAHQYFSLGTFCFYGGERKYGRRYILKALTMDPRYLFYWSFWRLWWVSALGHRAYLRLTRPVTGLKRMLKFSDNQ